MTKQILVNLLIALAWTLYPHDYSTSYDFIIGYLIGIVILFVLRRFVTFDFYMRTVWAITKLLFLFIYELIKANFDVIRIVLKPKLNNKPGIVAVPIKLKKDWEITLLAALISLTPGTLSMDFSQDGKFIYVHSLDVPNKEKMIQDIHNTFERAILEVSR
ncbi:Na+/H+ antiporter subunit E [Alkalihalobacillus trypoxylicola]|uniref:Cation:proton antiporter n=1 Tax=Alkalihalobacillus trypoxylicola TaxID=519424 RepID=A0A161Q8G6_9BACI|nr:Na+/H+ antiporter subunit E [Alkalihalobacillus trypoxylicola]KYG33405.1 cation:proton antiporter [Alkalihalobacillus trypoxylicola]